MAWKIPFDRFIDRHRPKAALLLRLAFGFHLMWSSTDLFVGADQREFAKFLAEKGVPWPLLSAYLCHITEFFGGAAWLLGAWVRPWSAALAFNFAMALLVGVRGQPYAKQFQAIQLLAASLFFLLHGAGGWSLDAWLQEGRSV